MPFFTNEISGRPLYPPDASGLPGPCAFQFRKGIRFGLKWPTEPKTASKQGREGSDLKPKVFK